MRIEHVAIWVQNLEAMKLFYQKYFHGTPGDRYHNPKKSFTSYFLNFEGGCRLELMQRPDIPESKMIERIGITHLAMSVGSRSEVDQLTEVLRSDGFEILGEPRTTGDGYYESVVQDPEGNRLEITI